MMEVKGYNLENNQITEKTIQLGRNVARKSFAKSKFDYPLPNLVEVQTDSFKWFKTIGMKEVLRDSSPISDFSGNIVVEFLDFVLEEDNPKYSVEESKERDVNYAAKLNAKVRIFRKGADVQEENVLLCELPLMTDNGTFVINGAERVVVSQIIRSPGMYYSYSIDKAGKKIYAAQIIPYRGAWLEYEVDASGMMFVRIDKNRKMPLTTLIYALGLETKEDVYNMFGFDERLKTTFDRDEIEGLAQEHNESNVITALKEIYKKVRPGDPATEEAAKAQLENYFFDSKRYDIQPVGRYKFDKKNAIHTRIRNHRAAEPILSPFGELLCEEGEVITPELAIEIERACVNEVKLRLDNGDTVKVLGNNTVEPEYVFGFDLKDCGVNEKARIPVMLEILNECGKDEEKVKAMAKARFSELCPACMTKDDIFASISYLIGLMHDVGVQDDIDHLGNRRIRSVGEQLQNQMRIGFARMEKGIRDRLTTLQEDDVISVRQLINTKPVSVAIRDFFGSSQLSQFMDQNNPLAELTHKRRLSALGPGGLSRDRASFDVRDVHYTQYGRMCPVETPEGPNIGLISYMTTYARISEYGFMMAPYRKVVHKMVDGVLKHIVTDEVEYMTADVEDHYIVAQANEPLDENGVFINRKVTARDKAEIVEVEPDVIDYMDVAPKMLVSVAAAMIPFLENDDNTRALMGSNMQKQAVPLMMTDSPIVGTGMEYQAARDSGVVILAKNDGVVERVQADQIVIACEDGRRDVYDLIKFKRTNQSTCFNQRPVVNHGDIIKAGDVIADGPATYNGEVSLGKNALIGFMTWEGYNYEDAVLLNEKLVREDTYTSLHIEEFTHAARVTKLGPEEITREIPNVGDDALKNLNDDGIIKIGTEVHPTDILVGKITPKGETELTPEERLLRAIFGEKTRDVRDTSLRMQHGESGIVVNVRVFTQEKDELPTGVLKAVKIYIAQKRKISVGDKMAGRHGNKGVVSRILPPEDMPFLPDGTPLDIVLNPLGVPSRMNIGQVLEVHLGIAARKLGWKIMTPVFDGATEKDIMRWLSAAGLQRDLFPLENPEGKALYEEITDEETGNKTLRQLSEEERLNSEYREQLIAQKKLKVLDGKIYLRDGRTGETFDNPVTVGVMYYLKLHHLVDDKIHARSIGPYSLITQQPLGGKAQFGGQRFGEMEVWALEAYGAAYTLQEILTIKSDDISGRRKAYEAIIKGQNIPEPGIPESFKVMIRELQSLALDVRVQDKDGKDIDMIELCTDDDKYARRSPKDVEQIFDAIENKFDENEDAGMVHEEDEAMETFGMGDGELSENDLNDDSDDE